MPITAIIAQPAPNQVKAAYRPIVLRVGAKKTDGTQIPPVVYCDIYIKDVYYKTISKTQYNELNGAPDNNSEWEFDIQDALQEYLEKEIPTVGQATIHEASRTIARVYCRFRSSGINIEGFITTEETAPVQGTGNTNPVSGTGTLSNLFYVVNAALQHEDSQDITVHLASYKRRTWDDNSFPLSHRPDHYILCKNDSDFFPILTDMIPGAIRLHYRLSGSSNFLTTDSNLPCTVVSIQGAPISLPDANVGVAYNYVINFLGSVPFNLTNIDKPTWMTLTLNGSQLTLSGTPLVGNVGTGITVEFDITNCGGTITFSDTIDVISCTIVSFAGSPDLPNGSQNNPYSYSFNLNGTQPFVLSNIIKPAWMTVSVLADVVTLSGTPDTVQDDIQVQFDISNCGGSIQFSDTLDILEPIEFVAIRYGVSVSICGNTLETGYTIGGTIASGLVVYTDAAGTTPLLGYTYILNAADGTIYELDPVTGTVGVSTGLVC